MFILNRIDCIVSSLSFTAVTSCSSQYDVKRKSKSIIELKL